MTRIAYILLVSITCTINAHAQSKPTWSNDVAPIIYRSCASCHHTGGIAPFPLTSYDEVAPLADMVNEAVVTRSMPPYPADLSYRRYAHERALSQAEITTISEWVAMGAPAGDLSKAPVAPTFDDGPALKSPDRVVTMPVYTSTATDADVYRCFTMPTNEVKDVYIDALEIVPGNPKIVHHVLVFTDTSSVSEELDDRDAEPGYVGFGGVGSSTAELVAVWAPGALPNVFPSGFGIRIPKGARIIFQMHYPKGTQGETDATSLRLRFASAPAVRPLVISSALNHENIVNKPFRIPANEVKTFRQRLDIPADISVLAVAPHMHLIGKSAKVWATLPSGDTMPIIHIPHWDFHWQIAYVFPKILRVPRGTVLESEFTYDNTTLNEHNPSNPPREVRRGESTTDEMMLTFFYYTLYRPGDENISLDVALTPTSVDETWAPEPVLRIAPNPTTSTAWLRIGGPPMSTIDIHIVDVMGRIVHTDSRTVAADGSVAVPVIGLPSGTYVAHAVNGDARSMQTFTVLR